MIGEVSFAHMQTSQCNPEAKHLGKPANAISGGATAFPSLPVSPGLPVVALPWLTLLGV